MNYLFVEIDETEDNYYEMMRLEDSDLSLDEAYTYCVEQALDSAEIIKRNEKAIYFEGIDEEGDKGLFLIMVNEEEEAEEEA